MKKLLPVGIIVLVTLIYLSIKPQGKGIRSSGENAIWAGNRWFTGYDRKENRSLTTEERRIFIDSLKKRDISRVYCHVGAVNLDGTLTIPSVHFFSQLQKESGDITWLPWIAGDAHRLDLNNRQWRHEVILSIARLRTMGFSGVHLNFEPVQDGDAGYAALLKEIRERFDSSFIISHATRRLVPSDRIHPLVKRHFWTRSYYAELIAHSDESVLMGYDTLLPLKKLYWKYISFQTRTLLTLAGPHENHRVRIGIPSYEHGKRSNPRVENITTALSGVKDGVSRSGNAGNFGGISIYAYWLTDEEEWEEYEDGWL